MHRRYTPRTNRSGIGVAAGPDVYGKAVPGDQWNPLQTRRMAKMKSPWAQLMVFRTLSLGAALRSGNAKASPAHRSAPRWLGGWVTTRLTIRSSSSERSAMPKRPTTIASTSSLPVAVVTMKGLGMPVCRRRPPARPLPTVQHLLSTLSGSATTLKPPAWFRTAEPDRTACANIASSDEGVFFDRHSWIIPGPPVSHRGAVPVFGMLEIMLRRHFVAGGPGLLGEFQVAGVLRHGALAAGLAAASATSAALPWRLPTARKLVAGRTVLIRWRHSHPRRLNFEILKHGRHDWSRRHIT